MFKFEVSTHGPRFGELAGWFQLAIGIVIIIGLAIACDAVFLRLPREPNENGNDKSIERRVTVGAGIVLLGALAIFIATIAVPEVQYILR